MLGKRGHGPLQVAIASMSDPDPSVRHVDNQIYSGSYPLGSEGCTCFANHNIKNRDVMTITLDNWF